MILAATNWAPIGAVAAAVVAGSMGLAGVALGRRQERAHEHDRWVRDQRFEHCLRLLGAAPTATAMSMRHEPSTEIVAAGQFSTDATSALKLLGPKSLGDAAELFNVANLDIIYIEASPTGHLGVDEATMAAYRDSRGAFIHVAKTVLDLPGD